MKRFDRWYPSEVTGSYGIHRPEVGDVVAYDRRAWEVTHISPADPTPDEQDRLNAYGEPHREKLAPYRISLRRIHGPVHKNENSKQDIGLRVPVGSREAFPRYAHGRVPLCSCHGHPWPCLEADQHAESEEAMKRANHELNLMPGCCPACQEPVTTRQRSITFPGPYVHNPLAEPNPAFHLRQKCHHAAARYENAWVAADPTAPRSLLTLYCEGTVIVHADGSGECFGADGSDCPSIYARHRCMCACYIQSHGCPRDCTPGGHGTRLAGYPTDPRAITKVATGRPT